MADDKTTAQGYGKARLSAEDNYEAQYLARKLGMTAAEARDMIRHFGDNREALERHKKLA